METPIDMLVDDCLLLIFEYIEDPLTLAKCATVCRRWEDLLEPRFEKFTELLLCDLTLCRTRRQGKICQIYRSDDFQTLMQHIGLNVTSVMLGVWEKNYFAYVICVRSQYEDFIYSMKYDFTPQDFIEILPKTCQNMSVLRITSSFKHDIQLTTNWVQELLENCRDLKALVLNVPLGFTNVSQFLTLPKLEYLFVTGVRFFSSISFHVDISSSEFKNLLILQVEFDDVNGYVDCSGLFDVIKRMPVLKYLLVKGLFKKEATKLSLKAIASQVNKKDIIVVPTIQAHHETMMVSKNVKPNLNCEPLRLIIRPQDQNYHNNVRKFVRRLNGCSVSPYGNIVIPSTPSEPPSLNNVCEKCFYNYTSFDCRDYDWFLKPFLDDVVTQ